MPKLLRVLPIFAALALPLVVVVTGIARRLERPAELLVAARERLTGDAPDYERALGEIERGIALAHEEGTRDLERALRLERARLFDSRGEAHLAARDCQEILAAFDPVDAEALELGAAALLRGEDFEGARAMADRLADALPGEPAGHRLAGEARVETGRALLAELDTRLAELHPRSAARELARGALENAARPANDRVRRRFEAHLAASFPDREREAGVALFRRAASELEAARVSFETCLALAPDGRAVAGLQGIFRAAGRPQDAADLGFVALERDELLFPTEVAAATAGALLEAGKLAHLREFLAAQRASLLALEALDASSLSFRERLAWCRTLFLSGNWADLAGAAWALSSRAWDRSSRAGAPPSPLPLFFQAAAELHLERPAESAAAVLEAARHSDLGELGDLLGEYHALEAELAARDGRSLEERALLERTLAELPDPADPAERQRIGRIHERLGEIALAHGASEEAERSFALAMALLPERRAELEPRWELAGREAEELARRPLDRRDITTLRSFAACALARSQLQRGTTREVALALSPVLVVLPGFPVALELTARAALLRGRTRDAIEATLELGEGGSPIDLLLDEIPRAELASRDLARLVALGHPSVRLDLAATWVRSGEAARAEALLRPVTYPERPAGEVGRAAALLAELGHTAEALARIESLPEATPGRADAVLALLSGALAADDDELLGRGVALASTTSDVFDRPQFLTMLDSMIALGELRDAWTLLGQAEQRLVGSEIAHEIPAREVLLRQALVLVLDKSEQADAALDRCARLALNDEIEVGRLLRAVDDEDAEAASRRATSLIARDPSGGPFARALVLAFTGDRTGALAMLAELEAEHARPLVPLARAWIEGAGPDALGAWSAIAPERGLAWLLALATRPRAFWTLERLRELPEELRATPWLAVLEAEALAQRGLPERAALVLEAALEPPELPPDSPPESQESTNATEVPGLREVWIAREALAAAALDAAPESDQRAAFEELQRLRAARIALFGPVSSGPAEVALAEAVSAGAAAEARELLERALAEHPEDAPLARELAHVALELGDPARSAELLLALLERAGPDEARELAPGVLLALDAERDKGLISPRALRLELEALAASRPEEPLFARALAEDLGRGSLDALEPLERFLERDPSVSVEAARPGEAERWCGLLRALDPERAATFARAELDHAPLSFALWREFLDSLLAQGRREEVLAQAERLLAIVHEPGIAARAALVRAELAPPSTREPLELDPRVLAGDPELARRALLDRLESGAAERAAALAEAERAWSEREAAGLALEPFAHRYAVALAGVDPSRARAILVEARAAAVDELDRALLGAFAALLGAEAQAPEDG